MTWANSGSTCAQSDSISPAMLGPPRAGPGAPGSFGSSAAQPLAAVVVGGVVTGSGTGVVDFTICGWGGIAGAVTGCEAR